MLNPEDHRSVEWQVVSGGQANEDLPKLATLHCFSTLKWGFSSASIIRRYVAAPNFLISFKLALIHSFSEMEGDGPRQKRGFSNTCSS
jgi:hypothetical protein